MSIDASNALEKLITSFSRVTMVASEQNKCYKQLHYYVFEYNHIVICFYSANGC